MLKNKKGFALLMMCLVLPIFILTLALAGALLIDTHNRELILNFCLNENINRLNGGQVLPDQELSAQFNRELQSRAFMWNSLAPNLVLKRSELTDTDRLPLTDDSVERTSVLWLSIKNVSPLERAEDWNLKCGLIQKVIANTKKYDLIAGKF